MPRRNDFILFPLPSFGVPYEYIDLEQHPDAVNQLRWLTGGSASHPTVYVGGEVLVEPNPRELNWALARSGLRSGSHRVHDEAPCAVDVSLKPATVESLPSLMN